MTREEQETLEEREPRTPTPMLSAATGKEGLRDREHIPLSWGTEKGYGLKEKLTYGRDKARWPRSRGGGRTLWGRGATVIQFTVYPLTPP